jgi:hypothetical protein
MSDEERQGSSPSDAEELIGDTAASDRLTERKGVQPAETSSREESGALPVNREPSRNPDEERSTPPA